MDSHLSIIDECLIKDLKKIHNPSGNLTIIQNGISNPFDIVRVYYLYDIPGGSERGGHAHISLFQIIVAVSGSFDIILDDSKNKKIIQLNRPYYGLLIVPGIWREIKNFSSGAICLVLASQKYDEKDYIRDYETFKQFKNDT